jgi:peptidylprolyl isomerase
MKKLAMFALLTGLLAVSALLFAQEEKKAGILKFKKGQERCYKLKWHHYYETSHPERGRKKMCFSKIEALVTCKVKKTLKDGGAKIALKVDRLTIDKSSDKADDWKDNFTWEQSKKAEPSKYLGKELELEVDKDGKVVKYPEIKSKKYASVFKAVFFGDSLLQVSEGLAKEDATIPVLHDMNAAEKRFKKADLAHVPFKFKVKVDDSKNVANLEGSADESKKLDLGKGLEWELEDVTFTGKVEGVYSTKENMWDSLSVRIEGKKEYGKDADGELKDVTLYLRWRIDIEIDDDEDTVGVMKTNFGKIVMEFYPDLAPKTVKRIRQLIRKKFYDGLTFHRVVPGFCIQGGCPLGNGTGGTGQKIEAEFSKTPYKDGSLGMARAADPNSNDCQFFITLGRIAHLDNKYTLFGKVIEGLDVAHKIEKVPTDNSKPRKKVKIISFRLEKRKAKK